MSTELMIYAIIAAILVFWLRNTLGTRHGEERERPNPLTMLKTHNEVKEANQKDDVFEGNFDIFTPKKQQAADDWTGLPIDARAREGLMMIAASDKNFNASKFLNGAKDAFPLIVESYADGDKESLARFLTPPLYKNFVRAIDERMQRGEIVRTDIHAVRGSDIIEAGMRGSTAFITVRFKVDETTVIKNNAGATLSGHPDKVTELNDVWVFGRDVKSSDPTWFLYETRDDVAEIAPSIFPHTG